MDEPVSWIGNRSVWGGEEPFGFSDAERRQHCYVIGQTGTGKSTLLKSLILQDIRAGRGVGLIDPHGDLAQDVLQHYPSSRADDLVYFDPADLDHPIAFNLLANAPKDNRHLVVSGLVSALKSVWRESFGPRMEYILNGAIAALLDCDCPNITLLSLQRMLADDVYRHWIVRHVKDPVVKAFWTEEFDRYDERFRREAIAPIQNKVGQLLMAPVIRNLIGQVQCKLDLRFMMDRQRVLIANLSKGKLGEDKSNLLGALLVAQFQQAAMSRSELPEADRTPFYLYVDEFQNFTSDSFASILSESRKYGLSITISHQYLEQLRPEVRQAVFGNVANLIAFRVGETDAAMLAREFGHAYVPETFTSLSNHHVLVRKLQQSQLVDPFRGITVPFETDEHRDPTKLIDRSRERFSNPRAKVEDRIRRWLGVQNRGFGERGRTKQQTIPTPRPTSDAALDRDLDRPRMRDHRRARRGESR